MEFVIRISARAYREYYDAYEWYETQSLGLGNRFENSLAKQSELIAKSPLIYANKKFDTREVKIEDFPYLIIYKIFRSKKEILITSIFHTSRNLKRKYRK